jgi:BASS family bile acid:Na+ symporter
MNPQDIIMVTASLASMAAGVALPGLAEPLAAMPRTTLIFMLYMSFLAVGLEDLQAQLRTMKGPLCRLTVYRLVLLALVCFAVFRICMPQFALGALLLGAAPVGVMAAVFSLMLGGNTALILVGNIATSLLLPLTLPLLLSGTDAGLRLLGLAPLAMPEHLHLGKMSFSLALTILLPFAAAHLPRVPLPRLRTALLNAQFPLLTGAVVVSNCAIFSAYSGLLRQSPAFMLRALLAACLLCLLMTLAALPLTRGMPRQLKLAFLISCGVINNVLLMIVCMEFFSATEALMAAAYLVPLYILLFYYRLCSRKPPLGA